MGYLGTTPTHHSQGNPMYKVEIHPPGKSFPPNGTAGVHARTTATTMAVPALARTRSLFFDPPADGTYQVRVADARGAAATRTPIA